MSHSTRQLGRGLSNLSKPAAIARLEAIAARADPVGDLRLLHTAVCSTRAWQRQIATSCLAAREMAPRLRSLPTTAPEHPEDRRLLRAIVTRLLRDGFRHKKRWDADLIASRLIPNPDLHVMARGLVWGRYEGERLMGLFMYDESGTAIDLDEEPIAAPTGAVGLPWTIELGDHVDACCRILSDYDLISPFSQLHLLDTEGQTLCDLVEADEPSPAVTLARRMNPRDVWAALEPLLEVPKHRRHVLDVFKGARIEAAIPLFEEGIHDPDSIIADLSMTALRLMGVESMLPAIASLALAGDSEALSSMANWQKRRGTKVLLPRMTHDDPVVRAAACLAACTEGAAKPIGAELIRRVEGDQDAQVRRQALIAAGRRFVKVPMAAVREVVALWPDDDSVRKAATAIEASHNRGY